MKAFLFKYIHLIACVLTLVIIGVYGFTQTELIDIMSAIPVSFHIETNDTTVDISLYQADDSHCYVFLPSHTDLEQVTINVQSKEDIFINGIKLYDGISCSNFEIGKEYLFLINNRRKMTLQFYQSANVATLYIDTATGNMERIHNDKNYEQPSSLLLIATDGNTEHLDTNCYLQGRGNSTWNMDKKPYALTLSSSVSLLGMNPSSSWILLANAMDETNLRNKIVYDLALRASPVWVPSCEYVDVYLNGSYNGLYLLTERIETDSAHLNINTTSGDFLCKTDLWGRKDDLRNPFGTTHASRMIEITRPKKLTVENNNRIQYLVNQMEQDILSCNPSNNIPNLDLDSWVFKYLIDEISANGDADLVSSYFYYTNNTFFAGPIWDYDSTLGARFRNENPCAFTAKNYSKAPPYSSPYYDSLYDNYFFYNRLTEMYIDTFLPLLTQLLNGDIKDLADEISSASQINNLRWKNMFEESNSSVKTADELINYLKLRVEFLNSAWIDGVDYCTVQIEKGPDDYYNIAVIKGEHLSESYLDLDNITWYNAKTNEVFDINQPITEDISLVHNL